MRACKKHIKTPAIIYGMCVGCELDGLRADLAEAEGTVHDLRVLNEQLRFSYRQMGEALKREAIKAEQAKEENERLRGLLDSVRKTHKAGYAIPCHNEQLCYVCETLNAKEYT